MKTIKDIVTERSLYNYSTRKDRYAKQSYVMSVLWIKRRINRFNNIDEEISLKEIWALVNDQYIKWAASEGKKIEVLEPSKMDLRNSYNSKPRISWSPSNFKGE